MLEVLDLYKSFGAQQVLQGLSFKAVKGERIALCGKNGSGKSTLLNILASLTSLTKGSFSLENIEHQKLGKDFKQKIGHMSSGSTGLFYKLTGMENIRYFAAFYKIKHDALLKKLLPWREVPVFKAALDTPFMLGSTGMKNTLLLFLALMHDPQLVLLDEPLASFDSETRLDLCKIIIKEHAAKIILFSCHHEEEKNGLASRQLTLEGGRFV